MKNKKLFIILAVVACALIIGLSTTVLVLLLEKDSAPDYNPITPDNNSKPIVNGSEGETMVTPSSGGGAVSISYSKDISISLSEGCARLYFANPKKSSQNVVVTLDIHDVEIAKSGLVESGNYIDVIEISDDMVALLSVGEYEAKLKLSYYDKESGELAVVNTHLEVKVTVVE